MPGLAKSSLVFKVFWFYSFVGNAIYRRKIIARKNKAIIKQKNQNAQKNVNSFLLNTRVKTKKGKIPSFWIWSGRIGETDFQRGLNIFKFEFEYEQYIKVVWTCVKVIPLNR